MSIDPMNRKFDRTDDKTSSEADSSYQLEDSLTLYAREVGRVPMLSPAEERELFRRKEAGDERAKRILIEANLRLVMWIARQYAHHNVPMLDLIQEGNLALTRAVERFDHRLGFRLSTYATLMIKGAVGRAAECHARLVPVPIHVGREIRTVRRARQVLLQRLGRDPLQGEIAAEAGLDSRRVGELLLRLVLRLRFGLAGQSPRSLVEVGRELGVTSERARQLEATALDKLRTLAPGLRNYLEVA